MAQSEAPKYAVVEGWEKLPSGYAHRDVAGVAVDLENRVFLICRGDHPIIMYDERGKFLGSWGEGDFTYRTHGISIGPDNSVFCTDDGNHTIRKFTPSGKLLMTLGVMNTPSDTGYDGNNARLQIFSPDGEYLTEWTDTRRPTHIVFDGEGRAYVSELWWQPGQTSSRYGPAGDIRSGRVSVYDRDGRVIARWGGPDPTVAGSFAAPHGLAAGVRRDV